jgi:polysaccharide export outer membrane protein
VVKTLKTKLDLVIVIVLVLVVDGTRSLGGVSFGLSQADEPNSKKEAQETEKKEPSPRSESSAKTAQVGDDFVIGAGDHLDIFVWKEPQVSKSVPVRPDGKISLPLVDDIQASGLTAMQLKAALEGKLAKFVTDPLVTVTVLSVSSQMVMVMGEVTGAGPKPLGRPTRVIDILATSGFTPFAKTTKIYILRNEGNKQERFNFNYKDYIKGKNPEQNILLKNGDTIVVP